MQILRGFHHPQIARACALTIGNFDGVHRGHQAMLALLNNEARHRGVPSCVLTFEPHPRDFFAAVHRKPELAPARIATLRDKLTELAKCGVDQCVILKFDARLSSQQPEAFIADVLAKGLTLDVPQGEVHAIMGPNGSGKSTLAYVLAGRPGYEVTRGSVEYDGRDLLALPAEERARLGVFLGFQYPVEIPGVNNVYLLKAALNAVRKQRGEPEVDAFEFLTLVREKMRVMRMDEAFLSRGVNEGFSGGEKKRNEILQMLVLEPRLAVLDETDSGLDIDALKIVAEGVNTLRSPQRSIVLVTHYQRLLDHVVPDRVHVLVRGRIATSGDRSLALELERRGYDWLLGEAA
jgi:Fe-S cluster assembly ATP-binding protein